MIVFASILGFGVMLLLGAGLLLLAALDVTWWRTGLLWRRATSD